MPTSFVTTTFVMIVTLNNLGELSPVDKSVVLPTGLSGPMVWSVEQCRFNIGKLEHPEKYTCQRFDSAKATSWTYVVPGSEAPPPQPESRPQADPTSGHSPRSEPLGGAASVEPIAPGACNAEEEVYDKKHRELYGVSPGDCVQPLDGYPTRAAGWLAAAIRARLEKLVEPKPEPLKEAPKPKKVAQQQPRQTQTAMFEGNPFSGLFQW